MTKIALVGSAPSSIRLAPINDPDWQIWGCSPGAYGVVGPRADVWFEMHRWEPQVPGHAGTGQPWFTPEYCEFLTRFKGTVYVADPAPPELPTAKVYPYQEMIDKYGPFFMTSSLSWMLALALETPGVTDIALYGVDMAANEEYASQRPGCQYFITLAVQRGINIIIPPESDLLQPSYFYGITETHPMMIKLTARRNELLARKQAADQRARASADESIFLSGALDDIDYMMKTWVTYQSFINPAQLPTGNESRAGAQRPEPIQLQVEQA